MMLPPFRIRDLYGQARHGVVQITIPQYDSTLKSHPDAALTYLDEDDGETITVGSGYELGQRLEDSVPQHKAARIDEEQTSEYYTSQDLHTFDIERTSNSIATWMDHEAYSSKSLRSLSFSSTDSANLAHRAIDLDLNSTSPQAQPAETLQSPSKLAESPTNSAARTELDMYEEMYDKEVQTTLPVTNEADASVNVSCSRPPAYDSEATDTVEKIVSDAVESIASNLDSHIDTLADFLQNTSRALRVVAEKTRESDTSAVESILSGFNAIFGEVGKLAKAVLDTTEADTAEAESAISPVELDMQQIHETSCDKRVGKAMVEAKSLSKENELSASVEVISDVADLPSPVLVSSPRPIVRVETLPAQDSRALPSRHNGTELTSRLPMSRLDKLYHIPSKSFIDNQPQEVPAEKDQAYTFLERGGFNQDSNRTWKYMPLPDDDQTSKLKKKVDFSLPSGKARSRETAKSSSEILPRSILDLEASDPDFSARFPPLMSVRRSKTMESLRQQSQSPDNKTRSRQDALKRFPSLGQLERRKVLDDHVRESKEHNARKAMKPEEKHISHMHRAWFETCDPKPVEPVKDVFTRQSDEVEEVIAAVGRDIAEASSEVRRLPGAWPEAQVDPKAPLPTSNESSGAFFNRMTGQFANLDKKQRSALADPYLAEWPLSGYGDHRAKYKPEYLERAKSVASFSPSATLTTPFDPLMSSAMVSDPVESIDEPIARSTKKLDETEQAEFEAFFNPGQSSTSKVSTDSVGDWYNTPKQARDQTSSKQEGIHRSATEKMPHRRPYSHRYSGAGRLPWESFEDRSFDLRTGSFVQRQERARRAADRSAHMPSVAYNAATRQCILPEYSAGQPSINPSVRQNPTHPIKLPSDLHQRVNDYRAGVRHRASMPTVGIAKQSKINDCAQQLKDMGFGKEDVNEANRLSVYAAATGGDIYEAVEMIEEDRKAANSLRGRRQTAGPENGPGGWF